MNKRKATNEVSVLDYLVFRFHLLTAIITKHIYYKKRNYVYYYDVQSKLKEKVD